MRKYEEKANELFNKYSKGKDEHGWQLCEFESCAKQCALIAVDEIILELDDLFEMEGAPCINSSWEYWQKVKLEIEKL